MTPRPEITWSLLHPCRPDPDYVRAVIAVAAGYRVDSLEICGECHLATGGIDGAIHFRDFPAVAAKLDHAAVDARVRRLRECIDLAHASGRPVYYWHREVMVPRAVVESVPGLLDEKGEFDLLGPAYHRLLRAKLAECFDHLPQLDGIVLTLTESDYSVIHNSSPERYPPARVVQALLATFAGELQRRRKRFVLRSFGSIARDYEDILAGAAAAAAECAFEVETKITPYDFSPFLPLNPYLQRSGRARLSAEYDSIGEFLGAGYLPAPDPARVIECVRHAQRQGVDRHVIRIDRIGHATFTSTQAINLLAFERAIGDPAVTADQIWREWSGNRWPACAPEMTKVMQAGVEMVKRTHFIDGHLIFHAFPIDPTMKWVKAAGILSAFSPGASLARHDGMWGIDAGKVAPDRATLLAEKDEAVALADEGLRGVRALQARLRPDEFQAAETAWRHATEVTRLVRAWCRCVSAYVDDMAAARPDHPALNAAIASAEAEFAAVELRLPAGESSGCPEILCRHPVSEGSALSPPPGPLGADGAAPSEKGLRIAVSRFAVPAATENEYGGRERGDGGIEHAYARPLWALVHLLVPEFEGEWAERAAWRVQPGLVDYIVVGGVADDHRVRRYMHASHARLIGGRPARAAGNRVFPNGFIECELRAPADRGFRIMVKGDPTASRGFCLTVNGARQEVNYRADGIVELEFPAAVAGAVTVRVEKAGSDYPWIFGVATVANSR